MGVLDTLQRAAKLGGACKRCSIYNKKDVDKDPSDTQSVDVTADSCCVKQKEVESTAAKIKKFFIL